MLLGSVLAGCSLLFDPTGADPGGDCEFRQEVDIRNPLESVADVPVLLRLTREIAPNLSFALRGADLRVTQGGARIPHEIDHATNEEILVWIRLAELQTLAPATVLLEYGGQAAGGSEDPEALWESFAGVWHMNVDFTLGGRVLDSSPHRNNGALPGASGDDVVEGQIGPAVSFARAWGHGEVPNAESLATTAITVEAWVSLDTVDPPLTKELPVEKNGAYELRARRDPSEDADKLWRPQAKFYWCCGGGDKTEGAQTDLDTGSWTYLVATYGPKASTSSSRIALYFNAQLEEENEYPPMALEVTNAPLVFGEALPGRLDEVRISGFARSPAWIGLQYLLVTEAPELITYHATESCR